MVRQIIQSSWRPTGGATRTTRLGAQPLETKALGLPVQRRLSGRGRYVDQPGARTGGGMGHPHQPVDPGAAGRRVLDRGEVEDHVSGVGQLLQYRVAERRADEVDVGIQATVGVRSDAGDRVPGRNQLPGHGTPEQSGDAGQQDPHARAPPRRLVDKTTIDARVGSQVTFS